MRRFLIARARRDERGAIAIMMAVSLTFLLIGAAMVLDFGLVRVDRQINKSAADSATLAGLHGLGSTGDGLSHSYLGVCTAVRYLQVNDDRFAGINESAGWTNGLDGGTGNGCSDPILRGKTCLPLDKTTWAKFHWAGTYQNMPISVTVESGYSLAGSTWAEDSLPASSPDTGSANQHGCDHLAITVTQSRKPGLGSLATDSDLTTSLRSVGRIKRVAGRQAPSLLLLKRTGCPVLTTGNSGGGSGTFIHVFGATTSYGTSQSGTIHSDSDGVGCTGVLDSRVFLGFQNDGIVAYAAPLVSNPTQPDPAKPGSITSVAAANGVPQSVVRDSLNYVYASSALSGTSGTKQEVGGRALIGRGLVDERYFPGVKPALSGAAATFFSGASGMPAGWVKFPASVNACKPTQAQVDALTLTASSSLYVDCISGPGKFVGTGDLTIPAGRIYFRGVVNPSGKLRMPNAHHVYVDNQGNIADGINLGNSTSFEMNNAASNMSGIQCSDGQRTGIGSKAVLFVRTGDIKETGGTLRMCRTTVFMMGGRSDGCVPAVEDTAPTTTPCAGALGNGQFTQTGGEIDWTAPDTLDATMDTLGNILPAATAAWSDPNGPEDLALWSESATNSSATYNMNGGGLFHVRGVYMVPNADPFKISGGALMDLRNAQYITGSISLNGGTQINMRVDPYSAVTLPEIGLVGLVR